LHPFAQLVPIELDVEEVDARRRRSAVPERREVVRTVLLQVVTIDVGLLDHHRLGTRGPALQVRLDVLELGRGPTRITCSARGADHVVQVTEEPALDRQTTRFHAPNLPIRR